LFDYHDYENIECEVYVLPVYFTFCLHGLKFIVEHF